MQKVRFSSPAASLLKVEKVKEAFELNPKKCSKTSDGKISKPTSEKVQ